jgi:hypothetical protein
MLQILNYSGSIAGTIGALVCAASGLNRFMGSYYLGGYESTTLFSVGMGLMVFACLLKVEVLIKNTSNN